MTKANRHSGKASKTTHRAAPGKAAGLSERQLDAATGGATPTAPKVTEIVITKRTDCSSGP